MKILENIKNNKFKSILIFALFIIFIFNLGHLYLKVDNRNVEFDGVNVFVQDGCIHCKNLEKYIDNLENKNEYDFKFYDITTQYGFSILTKFLQKNNINLSQIGTPIVIVNDNYMIGFDESKEGEQKFLDLINNKQVDETRKTTLKLPLFGEVDLKTLSLPTLAVVIGLADGFNPCAMWVLVYLISIAITLKDRKKLIILVGIFLITSGILYFLFMTAWLNLFLLIGVIKILNLLIGLFALYYGIMSFYDYIKSGGYVECKLSNNQTRQKSMSKIRELMKEDLSLIVIAGIVLLAFVVNSVEFLCSAALPATFTYILTQANLSMVLYYSYILLYTIMYMLDDFIVFGCAVFAINKYAGEKYEKYSTLIGGITMCLIGILVVFFPNLLK